MNQMNLVKNKRQKTFRVLPKTFISYFPILLNPLANFFISMKISPNALSIFALIAGLGAGILFFFERLFWAGILIIVCGLFDIIDGKVAVQTNKESIFGAMFDSTLDRYSEFFIYFGIAVYFRDHWALWLIFWTVLGSLMVGYTRARAEGLGIECKIGLMQRAERMVLLSLVTIVGSLFKVFDFFMIAVLVLITIISNITAIQRVLLVRRVERLNK
jgi:CDP-diacylglycerol--glycerol-3-phosphate 3-phosphatidyltransferase